MQNPVRANVMTIMKNRIIELEEENERLVKNRYISTFYRQIVDLMGNKTHHETEDQVYAIRDNLVFPIKKKNHSTLDEAFAALDESLKEIWKDPKILNKVIKKQPSLQSKLLEILLNKEDPTSDYTL
jgi:hypothetical protein